ncbi:MAG TPA: hypothetical protein PLS81_03820 [Deltaproteobacteria bacterium]|nr:hypothetical protein [Deltaproteobacteria bacterium]HOM28570.1 hypothetical protein [Deltaproteobacteria bacterium]HPP79919.1 hypothetical protein [Deltaproteobacteria bacterium]
MKNVYKIKRALVVPMAIALVISLPVFLDVFRRGYETRYVVMASLLVILFYLFTVNNMIKRVVLDETGISLRGLFGTAKAPFDEIKRVDGIRFGSRQFIALTARKNLLIPNNFERFSSLVEEIESRVPKETIADGFLHLKEHIVNRKSDITMAWIVVLLLVLCNVLLFFPHGRMFSFD